MYQGTVDAALLQRSVISVPPLCRDAEFVPATAEIARLARHLEKGGVTTLMYGGNANFYHVGVSDYPALLDVLEETAPPDAWVVPSMGPDYGRLIDQARILRGTRFPTAMVLPLTFPVTPEGAETGIRRAADALGRPVIAYVKNEGYLEPGQLGRLVADGVVCAVKYAIVRADPAEDAFLSGLVEAVDASRIISGIGERPVITHWTRFGLNAFTSGSVCVAPALSTRIKRALEAGDIEAATTVRELFLPLEDLRDAISPIRVLHEAVAQAGIAETGPMLPMLSRLGPEDAERVRVEAKALVEENNAALTAAQ